jgi:AraC family transcriptional regulator, transcriptional activator FtrA
MKLAVAQMTIYGHFTTMAKSENIAVILAYDGLRVFEFGIAFEIFGLDRSNLGVDWYDCRIVGLDGPKSSTLGGISIDSAWSLDLLEKAKTIVIPGWRDLNERPSPAVLNALRSAHARGARLFSLCTGVYVIAHTGLLDGLRATTHWLYADDFKEQFPAIKFEDDVLYVDEGDIITAAGSAAGIDAGLHLIRRDYGSKIANMVARRIVVTPHREGGQAQYVETPVSLRPGRTIGQAMDWARARLDQPLSVKALASQAAMSERTFLRQFEAATRMTPGNWLRTERIGRAKDLLETTTMPLAEISDQCGFQSLETFRSVFRRTVGIAPAGFRLRFNSVEHSFAMPVKTMPSGYSNGSPE